MVLSHGRPCDSRPHYHLPEVLDSWSRGRERGTSSLNWPRFAVMELSVSRSIFNLRHHRNTFHLHSRTSLALKKTTVSRKNPGFIKFATPLLRATTSEEISTSINEQFEEVSGVIIMEETPADGQNTLNDAISKEVQKEEAPMDEQVQAFEFLDRLNMKLDSEDVYSIVIYGSSALVTLWLASAVVSSIDSIPVLPKLLEIVGLAFTIWFGYRYLIFKNNREELVAKFEELKQQVIGPTDD